MNRRRRALLPWPLLRRRAAPALRFGIAAAVVAVSVGLAGCTPAPAPKPTPTPLFASKAEAFKAAEQVYRDYVDAANAQQNGNPDADPQQFLAGTALDEDIDSVRQFDESGLRVTGTSIIRSFRAQLYDPQSNEVEGLACLDVSRSRVVNAAGADVTPASRPAWVGLSVHMSPRKSGLKIVSIDSNDKSCS